MKIGLGELALSVLLLWGSHHGSNDKIANENAFCSGCGCDSPENVMKAHVSPGNHT